MDIRITIIFRRWIIRRCTNYPLSNKSIQYYVSLCKTQIVNTWQSPQNRVLDDLRKTKSWSRTLLTQKWENNPQKTRTRPNTRTRQNKSITKTRNHKNTRTVKIGTVRHLLPMKTRYQLNSLHKQMAGLPSPMTLNLKQIRQRDILNQYTTPQPSRQSPLAPQDVYKTSLPKDRRRNCKPKSNQRHSLVRYKQAYGWPMEKKYHLA